MNLVDTHCHIQSAGLTAGERSTRELWAKAPELTQEKLIENARQADVTRMIAVGCTVDDSKLALEAAAKHQNVWAAAGVHPHEAAEFLQDPKNKTDLAKLVTAKPDKLVAIGETGLDYFYEHSPKAAQAEALRFQIELAIKSDLNLIFHVREAFDDFWPIFDEYEGIKGVVHSFSAGRKDLQEILKRDLYVGLNGIMTFTKSAEQLEAAKAVPLDKLLLETDAPFLTPTPYRGTICEPKHVSVTAKFLADLREEKLEDLSAATTRNAQTLFGI